MTPPGRLLNMNPGQAKRAAVGVAALRSAWRAHSVAQVWSRPDDWYAPPVDAVVERLAGGHDPAAALVELGQARAEAGVGLDEALGDLRCLADVTGGLDPWQATKALCHGWQEATAQSRLPAPLLDPATDLGTVAYLSIRLRELYDAAAGLDRRPVGTTHCLVMVDAATACDDPWLRLRRGAVLGAVARQVFADGSSAVSLGAHSGQVVALVERGQRLGPLARRVRAQLDAALAGLQRAGAARRPVRVWIEALPPDYDQALSLLADLMR